MLTMPTCALFKSSSVSPMPYNIACAAGWVSSCVNTLLYLFNSFMLFFLLFCTLFAALNFYILFARLHREILSRVLGKPCHLKNRCQPLLQLYRNKKPNRHCILLAG